MEVDMLHAAGQVLVIILDPRRLIYLFAGISPTLWSMMDLAEMIDASLPKPGPRGPYEKRMVA